VELPQWKVILRSALRRAVLAGRPFLGEARSVLRDLGTSSGHAARLKGDKFQLITEAGHSPNKGKI
jgi:hypothetical protein